MRFYSCKSYFLGLMWRLSYNINMLSFLDIWKLANFQNYGQSKKISSQFSANWIPFHLFQALFVFYPDCILIHHILAKTFLHIPAPLCKARLTKVLTWTSPVYWYKLKNNYNKARIRIKTKENEKTKKHICK